MTKACSKIHPQYFDYLRNHTNAVEQSHQKSYTSGTDLTLVEAVKKYVPGSFQVIMKYNTNHASSSKLDKDDNDQYVNFRRYNNHHSNRTPNIETNYAQGMSQEGKCP